MPLIREGATPLFKFKRGKVGGFILRKAIFLTLLFSNTSCQLGNCFDSKWRNLPVKINTERVDVLEMYNDTFGTEIFVYSADGVTFTRAALEGKSAETLQVCDGGYMIGAEVHIDEAIEDGSDLEKIVVAHELGHVLGLGHYEDGLMTNGILSEHLDLAIELESEPFYSAIIDLYGLE